MIRCCGNCEFWQVYGEGENHSGDCRRNPPMPYAESDDDGDTETIQSYFPPTEWEEWCGEFKARKTQPLPTDKKDNKGVVQQD